MSDDFWQSVKPLQEEIEETLAAMTADDQPIPKPLREAMRYSLLAPGKRLRPLLTIFACQACGGDLDEALMAACSVELIHTYSLIHDDLPAMDDDDLRRGLPTCHVKFGQALAILAGDALQAMAFETLGHSYDPFTVTQMVIALARASGSDGMVGGQVFDLIADGRIAAEEGAALDATFLENTHRRKTGALINAALQLGQLAIQGEDEKGINRKQETLLSTFGHNFGLCFQITDDLLDVRSTAETTGKRVGKDAARGKLTYPGLLGIEASQRKADELAAQAIAAAHALGKKAQPLVELARFAATRNR